MSGAKKRKVHPPEFKAKAGLEARRRLRTINEICEDFGMHLVQVSQWEKEIQAQRADRCTSPAHIPR